MTLFVSTSCALRPMAASEISLQQQPLEAYFPMVSKGEYQKPHTVEKEGQRPSVEAAAVAADS